MSGIEILKIFMMAIVQGIGEFLPISSSGHLFVLGKLFFGGIDEDELMTLNILLHAGTLLSILVIFRKWIWRILTENRRLIVLLIVGTIPTGIIGILVKKECSFLSSSLQVTGLGFLFTGWLLLKFLSKGGIPEEESEERSSQILPETEQMHSKPLRKTLQTMSWLDALIIGTFQGIAVLPGVSRSGATIVGGVLRKLRPEDSAVFSFLLAIPAIGGAVTLEMTEFISEKNGILLDSHLPLYLWGAVVSFLIGLISLVFLLKWLKQGKLGWFAWWLFFMGAFSIIWGICS